MGIIATAKHINMEKNVEAIIEQAKKLGKAIAGSPQAAALRAARAEIDKHDDVKKTLSEFQQHIQKVARLEEENKPIEVEDKHKLQELQDRLLASDVFKKFTEAQVEYVDLMRKVNQALQEQLGETGK